MKETLFDVTPTCSRRGGDTEAVNINGADYKPAG